MKQNCKSTADKTKIEFGDKNKIEFIFYINKILYIYKIIKIR